MTPPNRWSQNESSVAKNLATARLTFFVTRTHTHTCVHFYDICRARHILAIAYINATVFVMRIMWFDLAGLPHTTTMPLHGCNGYFSRWCCYLFISSPWFSALLSWVRCRRLDRTRLVWKSLGLDSTERLPWSPSTSAPVGEHHCFIFLHLDN